MEQNKTSILTELFNSRLEEISKIAEEQRQEMDEIDIPDIDMFFPDATEEQKDRINDYVELNKEKMCKEEIVRDEKYYKFGISDLARILFEALLYKN